MKDWIEVLDGQITAHKRKVLIGKGTVSHAQAIKKAEQEFEICRQRELEMQESDFDRDKETQRKELILSPNLGFGVHARVHGP